MVAFSFPLKLRNKKTALWRSTLATQPQHGLRKKLLVVVLVVVHGTVESRPKTKKTLGWDERVQLAERLVKPHAVSRECWRTVPEWVAVQQASLFNLYVNMVDHT
jgi:hypothetical protein